VAIVKYPQYRKRKFYLKINPAGKFHFRVFVWTLLQSAYA
jgi:hypothetical protein